MANKALKVTLWMSNNLEMECVKCKVANTCPSFGSSPMKVPGGYIVKCVIVGGFGRTPIDQTILSDESKEKSMRDGPCLTIAEIPSMDDDGRVSLNVTKIFSEPVLHDREKVPDIISRIYPKSHSLSLFSSFSCLS